MKEDNDWIWDKQPGIRELSPRLQNTGPDALRAGSSPDAGHGEAFIFLPNGEIEWSEQSRHELMLDPKNPQAHRIIGSVLNQQQQLALAADSTVNGEPFADGLVMRAAIIKHALFGRVGRVRGGHF